MSRTPTQLGLLIRHGRAVVAPTVVLAILALLASGIAALAPRLVELVAEAELRTDVQRVAAIDRDVTTSSPVPYLGVDDTPKAFAAIATKADEPLRDRLATADWFARTAASPAPSDDAAKNGWIYSLEYQIDPAFAGRVTYTAGRAPRAGGDVVEIAMSTRSAAEMRWDVGETRTALPANYLQSDPAQLRVRLVGTYDAIDPAAPYWGHSAGVLVPYIFDDGNKPKQVRAVAIIDPAEADIAVGIPFQVTGWYAFDLSGLNTGLAAELLPPVRKFIAARPDFGQTGPGLTRQAQFGSAFVDAVSTAGARSDALRAILAVIGIGPFGAMIAVFELAVRTIVTRRRPTIALAGARGASPAQIRGALALEGVVGGLLPGLIGIAIAIAVVPGGIAPIALIPALLLALVPIAFLALAPAAGGIRETRPDGATRRAAAVRVVVEIAIWLLAAGSVTMLVLDGLGAAAADAAPAPLDPFVVAAPILLALAVCVLVLRLMPPLLGAVHAAARRSRGMVGFTGSARAVRERGLGVGAALSVVVAVGITIFAVVLGVTVSGATRDAARLAAGGSDAILASSWFSEAQIAATKAVPGVTGIAPIEDLGQTALGGWSGPRIDVVAADTVALAAVRDLIPAGMTQPVAGAIPAIVSAQTAARLKDSGATLDYRGTPIDVVGVLPADPGWRLASLDWVLIDTTNAAFPSGQQFAPGVLLVRTAPDATVQTVDLVAASGAAYASSADEALRGLRSSPAVATIGVLLTAAAALAAALALIAIVLSGQLAAVASRRVYGALRTLGATRSQIAGLAIWSVAPSVVAALVAGVGLGIGLPFVIIAGVDLAPFTGGTAITAPELNPLTIAAIALVLLIDAAAISMLAAAFTVRRSPAATVSIGGD